MVVCLAHAYIKPKELKVLMNKINALITFDMFFVYVVLKYALVILENLPSCELCLKKAILNCIVNELLRRSSQSSTH